MSRVGDKIKNARMNSGISQKQLAKKIGVSEAFIKDVELGRKIINESVMSKIAKVLGKDLNDITMNFETETFQDEKVEKKIVKEVSDVWDNAFSSVLKNIPIYDYNMNKPLKSKQLPITNNKIEGHAKDKVLFLKIQDDDMKGFRILSGDIAFGYITHEIFNNSICLVEYKGERHIRQIKRLDNSKLLLISNGNMVQTETVGIKDIKVLVKLEKLEIQL